MALRLSMLSAEDKNEIHGRALEILEKVGIKFRSEKVCRILGDAGCDVDWNNLSAKIPRALVEAGLKTLPSRFTLAAPDPGRDIDVGGGTPWYTAGGQCPSFKDLKTGERRQATSGDLLQCAQLIDSLDVVDEWCPMVVPNDIAPEMMELKILEISLLHNRKHFIGGGADPAAVPFLRDLFDAVLGDRRRLKQRPIWSYNQTPISPLQNDGNAMELVLNWADYQIPILLTFLPLSGGTGPVTLEGTILQETANFLGNMAFYQLVSPGWPIIWVATAGTLDMRTGRWSGMTESVLMSLALIEMAKSIYHVPVSAYGQCSHAKSIDFQSGMDAIFSDSVLGLAGVDNLWGIADLDGSTYVDLDYVLLATEAIRATKRLRRGLTIDADHLLTEVILEEGFDASYIGHKTTAGRFRREHLLPDLLPCTSYQDWEQRGKTDAQIARERLIEIFAKYEPIQHPPDVQKEVDRIMTAAERELLKNKRTK
jgi:trimethylamine--corrinoid protein Co-methyltransferase